ncbi:MAG: VWA domain-containing protein, partial [Lentisphaeria bacterium]|nr:VWA domain-containing protein [Lentisphaeria bacterium]
MAFLDENVLWHLFWVIPLFFILTAAAWKRRRHLLEKYPGKDSLPADNILLSRKARTWRIVLLFLTIIFLFLALARPFWGNRLMPYSGEGRDLLFVFDVSRSMYAQDVRPNRLEHAKYLVRELVKLNPGDRFGLIAFAGTAFLECPMTMDKTSFLQNLDELAPSSIPVGGTNIEEALKTALRAFKGAESTNRAIILVTDGDELTGESSKALDEAIKLKIPLFIAGIGDPSEPAIIRIPDGKGAVTTLRDEKGNVVNSRLNEKSLAALASKTGGIYVRSSTSVTGINELEARIRTLNKDLRESGKQTKPIERPLYPLTAALVCFILFLLIPEVPRRKKVFFLLLFPVLFLDCGNGDLYGQQMQLAPPVIQQDPQGLQKTLPADRTALSPQVTVSAPEEIKNPNDPFALYNAACKAHFEKKNIPEAKELYLQALSKAGDHSIIRDNASLNLGTIEHTSMRAEVQQAKNSLQKQELQKALEEVKKAITKTEAIQELYKYGLLGATAQKAAV